MDIIDKRTPDLKVGRKLILGAYVVVAVPVSGLLWQLMSPARQMDAPQPFLPMRDAASPTPAGGGSLTPPLDSFRPAASRSPRSSAKVSSRTSPAAGLAHQMDRLLAAGKQKPSARSDAAAGAKAGRLSPFSSGSLGGGMGGGSGSGASFGLGGAAAPRMASAGPSGSVGLVTTGASKRFTPARLGGSGSVSGLLGSGLQALSRLVGGGPNSPSFAGATGAVAGAPGFTSGVVEGGGLASVGEQVIGGMTPEGESEDNSTFTPPEPEEEEEKQKSTTPPGTTTGGGLGTDTALSNAACEIYKEAEATSSTVLELLSGKSKEADDQLIRLAGEVKVDLNDWKSMVDVKGERSIGKMGLPVLIEPTKSCLETAKGHLGTIEKNLTDRLAELEKVPGSPAGYEGALNAIDLELVGLEAFADYGDELAGWPKKCEPQGLLFDAANAVGDALHIPTGEDWLERRTNEAREVRSKIEGEMKKSWCERHGCQGIDLAAVKKQLVDHDDSLREYSAEASADDIAALDKTSGSLKSLEEAEGLLSSLGSGKLPKTGVPAQGPGLNRPLVNGAKALQEAAVALGETNRHWTQKREEACGTGSEPASQTGVEDAAGTATQVPATAVAEVPGGAGIDINICLFNLGNCN